MGGRDTGPQGVERPEVEGREAELEGRESSLLTGILLGGFGPPGAACSLAIVTLLPSRHLKHCTRNTSLHFTPPLHRAASWPLLAPALAPGAPAACRAPRPPGETGHWASRGSGHLGTFPGQQTGPWLSLAAEFSPGSRGQGEKGGGAPPAAARVTLALLQECAPGLIEKTGSSIILKEARISN